MYWEHGGIITATRWQIGDRIQNRWQIHKIFKGGMGIVYIVYDHEWREAFAAKTFQNRFLHSKALRDTFVQEAHTWISLDLHRHIVRARFVEIIEGRPFVFLEYVPSGDLSRWIGTPPLTLEQILRFAIQFCYGMEHAYSKGIKAHRDIKPQNCLITEDKILKITDFGLARVARMQEGKGSIGGTPEYMPPEQWDAFEQADERADIYSFGAMLYEMLAGQPPFGKRPEVSEQQLERRHKEESPPTLDPRLATLDFIVQTCLHKAPDQRYASFSHVRERLVTILEQLTGERVPTPVESIELKVSDLNSKGSSLNYLQKYSDALFVLERALQRIASSSYLIHPSNHSMVWNNKGFALMGLGRRGDAMISFDTALAIDPTNFHALTNKGHLLFELGRPYDALQCHERALSIDPGSSLAWNNKGRTLHAVGELGDAWTCYEKALQIDPRNTLTLGNMGWMLAEIGRHEEALVWFDRALAVDPFCDEALNAKALSLAACDRHEDALTCLEKAVESNPRNPVLWQNAGSMYLRLKRHQEALNAFDKALELDPGRKIARQGREICRMMLQEEAGVIDKRLQEAVELHSTGRRFHQFGQCEEAIRYFDRSLAINSHNDLAWYDRGNSLRFLGRHHEAIVCYERALSIDARFADAWGNMGVSYGQLGQHKEALECFEQALQITPQDAHWWAMKGSALQNLGKDQEAETCYARAAAIESNLQS
jgi:tetratricopeptide (TPR) repeat protein